jgi:hypothetical protein
MFIIKRSIHLLLSALTCSCWVYIAVLPSTHRFLDMCDLEGAPQNLRWCVDRCINVSWACVITNLLFSILCSLHFFKFKLFLHVFLKIYLIYRSIYNSLTVITLLKVQIWRFLVNLIVYPVHVHVLLILENIFDIEIYHLLLTVCAILFSSQRYQRVKW